MDAFERECFATRFFDERGVENFDVAECLENVASRAANPSAYFVEVLFDMDTRDDGGAKLIFGPASHNESDASSEIFNRYVSVPGGERVFVGRVLDIHRPKIDEFGRYDAFDNIREGAIGVELQEETH